jgi:hypothetical protein
VRWKLSAAPTSSHADPTPAGVKAQRAATMATSRRCSPLMGHSRGLTNQVLIEVFDSSHHGGSSSGGGGAALRSRQQPRGSVLLVGWAHHQRLSVNDAPCIARALLSHLAPPACLPCVGLDGRR